MAIDLAEGSAQRMDDGLYMILQDDDAGVVHSVAITRADMLLMIADDDNAGIKKL